jgi:hypothetical protein
MSGGQDKKEPKTAPENGRAAICKMCGGQVAVLAEGQKEESEERACKPESAGRAPSHMALSHESGAWAAASPSLGGRTG